MKKVKIDITFILLIIFSILSIIFCNIVNSKIFVSYINPLIWIIVTIYVCKNENFYARFKNKNSSYKSAFIFSLVYLVLYFGSGMIFDFNYSPYSHTLINIVKNIFRLIVPIICMEIIRDAYIIKNKKNILFIILCTIMFVLLEFNAASFINVATSSKELFKNICSVIFPLIMSNILYTYFDLNGSYKMVLLYRLPIELVFILVPIFPNHNWFIQACFGIIPQIFFIISLRYLNNERNLRNSKTRKQENIYGYIPVFIICIFIVLFMYGAFKYELVAIVSNSMVPIFSRGDAVLYEKLSDEALQNIDINNIIIYGRGGQVVVHRVIDKWESNEKIYYLTKGDANDKDDYLPVEPKQIVGVYKFSIKYLGYPAVWLNDVLSDETPVVETK